MEEKELTPEESFALINSVIQNAKYRFVENGHIYMFWGILVFLITMAQFVLLQLEMWEVNYFPYFLFPFGIAEISAFALPFPCWLTEIFRLGRPPQCQ